MSGLLVADADVDVVYVATPHSEHLEHALLAIAAGNLAGGSVPVGLAYGELAGLPLAGIYGSMLPLLAYALFGSSRQLVVGPDTTIRYVTPAVERVLGRRPDELEPRRDHLPRSLRLLDAGGPQRPRRGGSGRAARRHPRLTGGWGLEAGD